MSLLVYINGLVQDCSNSRASWMELPQSCTKPLIWNPASNGVTAAFAEPSVLARSLSPIQHQAITWTDTELSSIAWTLGTNLNLNQNTIIFIEENIFENVVCKMCATLFSPQCVTRQKCLGNHYQAPKHWGQCSEFKIETYVSKLGAISTLHWKPIWGLFQYLYRRFVLRSCKASNPWFRVLKCSHHLEIWYAAMMLRHLPNFKLWNLVVGMASLLPRCPQSLKLAWFV